MSEKTTDKIKEQCLETILSVVPMGQFIFVLATAVILFRIDANGAASPILALKDLGIKGLVGFEKGQFWLIGALYILASFFLALLNDYLFKLGLKRSYDASKVLSKIDGWMARSNTAMDRADKDLRTSVHDSISKELDKRISRYRSKRLLCEMSISFGLTIIYASAYLCLRNTSAFGHIHFSTVDFLATVFCFVVGWAHHRSSVIYAIRKIIPLQVYLSASTGELAFFIDID
ncbi:hypothetical protein [Paraburkholderia bryophila]|uniref:Uncharacterized protein n=1 Tax=Paraburkholderia bryophila TaxID=420952 RepID=A0A329BLR4_9BURK|nr:hypothetical protein [Paraburkholderia bryophila]RAS22852.1 hypothetical protein BX591_12257 [Paraburkholderia bryophila]